MKRVKFTETQIVSALKKQENGMAVKDIARELGITPNFPVLIASVSRGKITAFCSGFLVGVILRGMFSKTVLMAAPSVNQYSNPDFTIYYELYS